MWCCLLWAQDIFIRIWNCHQSSEIYQQIPLAPQIHTPYDVTMFNNHMGYYISKKCLLLKETPLQGTPQMSLVLEVILALTAPPHLPPFPSMTSRLWRNSTFRFTQALVPGTANNTDLVLCTAHKLGMFYTSKWLEKISRRIFCATQKLRVIRISGSTIKVVLEPRHRIHLQTLAAFTLQLQS